MQPLKYAEGRSGVDVEPQPKLDEASPEQSDERGSNRGDKAPLLVLIEASPGICRKAYKGRRGTPDSARVGVPRSLQRGRSEISRY